MLSKYLDIINVMTYDYHGHWDKKTGHVAPMYYHPEDDVAHFNAVSTNSHPQSTRFSSARWFIRIRFS